MWPPPKTHFKINISTADCHHTYAVNARDMLIGEVFLLFAYVLNLGQIPDIEVFFIRSALALWKDS